MDEFVIPPSKLPTFQDSFTGNSVLMYATMDNRLTLMERILALGCDINAVNQVRVWAENEI